MPLFTHEQPQSFTINIVELLMGFSFIEIAEIETIVFFCNYSRETSSDKAIR